jgi:archaellum biogenesis ATPase FlaH
MYKKLFKEAIDPIKINIYPLIVDVVGKKDMLSRVKNYSKYKQVDISYVRLTCFMNQEEKSRIINYIHQLLTMSGKQGPRVPLIRHGLAH